MADDTGAGGAIGDDPTGAMGANEGDLSATAGQEAANSGALGADALEKLNKRMDDMRSQMDRERDAAANRESKLLEALTAQRGGDTGREQEAVSKARADLEARYDAGELTGKEFIGLMDGIASDTRAQLESQYGEKLTASEKRFQELQASIDDTRFSLDPAYVARKEQVDAIQAEMGVDRALALKIAAKLAPTQPPRQHIPSATGTGVVAGGMPTASMDAQGFAELEATLGVKLDQAARQALNAKWAKGNR